MGVVPAALLGPVDAVAADSPSTVTGEDAAEPVAPLGLAVAMYEVTGLPPLSDGGAKDTDAARCPAVAETAVGAPGRPGVATGALEAEFGPVPAALMATTTKV